MTEMERLRAEIEGLRILCASIYQEAPPQISKVMKKAARDALKAHTGLTEDQRAVMARMVLLTSTSVTADDPRLPKDPDAAPAAAASTGTSGVVAPAA